MIVGLYLLLSVVEHCGLIDHWKREKLYNFEILELSINILSIVVLEILWDLVGKLTIAVKLYVWSTELSRLFFIILGEIVNIYVTT